MDDLKEKLHLPENHPYALGEAIKCCRKGGTVSVPGVYTNTLDRVPMNAVMNKGLTIKTGQTHVPKYMEPLMEKIAVDQFDPSFVITHHAPLAEARAMYEKFANREDGCVKAVLNP